MNAKIGDAGEVIRGSRKEMAALRRERREAPGAQQGKDAALSLPTRIDELIDIDWGKAAKTHPPVNVAYARALAETVADGYRKARRSVEAPGSRRKGHRRLRRRYELLRFSLTTIDAARAVLEAPPMPAEALALEAGPRKTKTREAWFRKADLDIDLSPISDLADNLLTELGSIGSEDVGLAAGRAMDQGVASLALGYLMAGHGRPMRTHVLALRREGEDGDWMLATARHGVRNDPAEGDEMAAPGVVVRTLNALNAFPSEVKACRELVAQENKIAQGRRLEHGEIEHERQAEASLIAVPLGHGIHVPLEWLPPMGGKEAQEHIRRNYARLAKLGDERRRVSILRQAAPKARIGPDHRADGKEITTEAFIEKFGFRGIQWGNYVKQSERQDFLHHGHDAFMDLADVLGVSPQALSLGGSLGIAFGARGRGGTKAPYAHYEPDERVINLTKGNGYGTLAHEWLHALDYHLGAALGLGLAFTTEVERGWLPDKDTPLRKTAVGIQALVTRSELKTRSDRMDRKGSRKYFGKPVEIAARSFEGAVARALSDAGRRNHLLVLFSDPERCPTSGWGMAGRTPSYPYPYEWELLANGPIMETMALFAEAGVTLACPGEAMARQPFRVPRVQADAKAPAEPRADRLLDEPEPWVELKQMTLSFA